VLREVASRFEWFGRNFGSEDGVRPPAGLVEAYLQEACRGPGKHHPE
jgi:hypothetical protein